MSIQIDEDEVSGLDLELVEAGTLMPVLDANNEPKYLGGDPEKPMQVRVRSIRSAACKAASLRIQKRTTAMNKGRRTSDVQIPNETFIAINAAAATAELINFSKAAPVQKPQEKELETLFSGVKMEDLANQIWEWSRDDTRYGAKTPGNGSAETDATRASQTSAS